jgi:hypothetical protein
LYPSPFYQTRNEGLLDALDECRAAVRSVDQVTLLLLAAGLDSATATAPGLPIVGTVSDDDYMLASDATCATSADTTTVIAQRPLVRNIRVVKSDIPCTPRPGFLRVSRCVRIRYRLQYRFSRDVYVRSSHPRLCPTYYDDLGALDHQVKTISTTSVWLLD